MHQIRAHRKVVQVYVSKRFQRLYRCSPNGYFLLIKRNVMQFLNYILWVHSFQQLFIWAPTILKIFSHTYIHFDLYPETVGVATIEMRFSQHVLLMPFSLVKLLKAFYWPFKWHTILNTSVLMHDQRAKSCKVTKHWNGGLVESHHHHTHICVLRSSHLRYQLFLEHVIRLYRNMPFLRIFGDKYNRKSSKKCITIFSYCGK